VCRVRLSLKVLLDGLGPRTGGHLGSHCGLVVNLKSNNGHPPPVFTLLFFSFPFLSKQWCD